MLIRIISALIGGSIFWVALYLGDGWFFIMMLLIALLALRELIIISLCLSTPIKGYLAYPALLLINLAVYFNRIDIVMMLLFIILVVLAVDYILTIQKTVFFSQTFTFWAICYIGLLSIILSIRQGENGLLWSGLLIALVWISDSGAYFSGMIFGKHYLAPVISPKKTVEGSLGALLLSAAAGYAAFHYIGDTLMPWQGIILGLLVSAAGQIGDLSESAIKRSAQVKDSGSLIPGHGGFLDRFDSLIIAVPVYYIVLLLMIF